jgi:thermitase
LIVTTLSAIPQRSYAISAAQAESSIPGEFIVGFKKEFHIPEAGKQLAVSKGGKILKQLTHPALNAILVRVPLQQADAFQQAMKESPLVRYVEPNLIVSATIVPNDPKYRSQWSLPKIQAPQAWDISTGSSSVRVGVIDTGIDYNHQDIAPNYASCGYDWVNNDADPMDDYGHGTHAAGIIAARTNNLLGVAGVAGGWGTTHGVTLIAEKVLDSTGSGSFANVALGITDAVDNCGVQVINLSLANLTPLPPPGPTEVRDALQYAADHGVISVAAAGNNNGADASGFYPCAYGPGHPFSTAEIVMCVSATDSADNIASFSNIGNPVDISAPGVNIRSTYRGSYASLSGTSMATPHVAAVVALVMSQFPSYTRDQVWNYVLAGAEDRGAASWDAYYGWGRLNAYLTLSAVTVTITKTLTSTSTLYTPGTTTATSTSYTSTTTSTSTIPALTTVVLVPLSMTSTVQSTQFFTSFVTTTVTSYTSTQSSTSTIIVPTTVVLVPYALTSTVQSTQYETSFGTTAVTSHTSTTTSTSTTMVYTTVTELATGAAASSPLTYLGFLSLLALTVGHTVTADKGWRIPRSRSRMERRRSTS